MTEQPRSQTGDKGWTAPAMGSLRSTDARPLQHIFTSLREHLYGVNQEMDTTNSTIGTLASNYLLRETVYFTSTGTFTKASYPWLRAMRVKAQAGGGGSGGCATTGAGQAAAAGGGGAGGYSESFITDISGLAASVTVTVGGGGNGGAAGNNSGSAGGSSSFGSLVSAGGNAGAGPAAVTPPQYPANGGTGGAAATGDFTIAGGAGETPLCVNAVWHRGSQGGSAFLGPMRQALSRANTGTRNATAGTLYGAGANGGSLAASQTQIAGAAGGAGIVILELYA